MKNILVTGGAGYIGSHTSKLLIEQGYNVIILDSLVNGHRYAVPKKARFYKIDLGRKKSIEKVFSENKIDCVIHFAAFIEAGESMVDPKKFFRNNLINTLNLLEVMIDHKVLRMIFSSTAAVYGNPKYIPVDENHPKEPTNYYGTTKLMVEEVLKIYNSAYKLKFIALRYFNAAGADESGVIGESHNPETHLIPLVLQVAKGTRKKIFIFGDNYNTKDGTCVRDYIHVNDLAEAHILAMKKLDKLKSEFFNLGNGKGYSVMEVVETCRKVTGHKIPVKITKRRPGDPAELIADYKKTKKILGWSPKHDLTSIIKTAWKWEQKK